MSIAEKLQTIAENEQKVYNAGFEKGKSEGGDTETAYNNGFNDGKQVGSDELLNVITNNKTNFSYLFCGKNALVTAPILDTSEGIRFDFMFNACISLVEVPLINISKVRSTVPNVGNMFTNCTKLVKITFEGIIPISISFADCSKLNNDSINSIITALKDLTGGTAQTLTLHNTVGSKLTDEQKAIITAKNWTLVY